nr:hypothetical protein [Kibdelosporangium sp. MJ126-NF4]CTQ94204.1 hypothetical protein [Kibdelosporangium sp. MJ126-NF4]
MDSDDTEHYAWRTSEGWNVTWLPDRVLSRNEAVTAMSIAEVCARNPDIADEIWRHVWMWLDELGLTSGDFLDRLF